MLFTAHTGPAADAIEGTVMGIERSGDAYHGDGDLVQNAERVSSRVL